MISQNNSKEISKTQASLAARFDYNTDTLDDFLTCVFHTELDADENILCWMTSGGPKGYPLDEETLLTKLDRVPIPKALYFGTSTCKPDEKDGILYNRKALFSRLHVVVLDDIGTKVPIDKLPAELEPTYIIESSTGNFQYGYVLEEPIRELELAEALIQIVYESGFTDSGGKMVTKLVRLPDGINGKKGNSGLFHVKLHKQDGPLWSPERLLEVLDLDTTWADVLADTEGVLKQRASKAAGLTVWSPVTPNSVTLDGLVDPVLEWLYDLGYVKQETNDWVTIRCPWSDQHTSGDGSAGYSPLGRGTGDYKYRRNFHCFHEHCTNNKAGAFLEWVAANEGPEAAITEQAAKLLASYAYDPLNDAVWEVKDVKHPRMLSMRAFNNLHPKKVLTYTREGKCSLIAETSIWRNAPNRVVVYGETYDPTTPAVLVQNSEGENLINTFTLPDWGKGVYKQDDVDTFNNFLDYLIPETEDREYFISWLAAKAQNMGFRGAAIIMIAGSQGTGRTTLSGMLSTLFGSGNLQHVPFDELVGNGQFNDWVTTPIIVTDETLSMAADKQFFKVYEGLKEIIDVTPKPMRVNPKYGKQRVQTVYSSYLLFSNHQNAMAVAHNDRRFYVMNNPDSPAEGIFFTTLHAWLNTKDANGDPIWAQQVWRWLQTLEPNLQNLLDPVKETAAKTAMLDASKTPIHLAIEAALRLVPSPLVAYHQLFEIVQPLFPRLGLDDVNAAKRQVRAIIRDLTSPINKRVRVGNKTGIKLKLNPLRVSKDDARLLRFKFDDEGKGLFNEFLASAQDDLDIKALRKKVEEVLDSHDY